MTESTTKSSAEVVGIIEEVPIRVLHVDDEAGFLRVAKQCLEMEGNLKVETASSVEEAMEKLEEKDFDTIVSDYVMPGKDGLEFLKELRYSGNNIPFIIFTGKGREEVAIKALNLGADRYFNKVGDPETVYGELAHGIRQSVEGKWHEERLSALNIYSQKLNLAQSMEEIYRLTLDAMEKTLGFEHGFFMIVDKDMLCIVAQCGYPGDISVKLPLDGSERGVSVKVARTGKSIIVPDAEKEDDWVEFWPSIRSGLDVPVKIGHEILGVVGVDNKTLNAFNEKDQKLLEILASHAATAISNLKHAKNLEAYARETRESQEKFERLFMDNPEATVYLDPDFHILGANPRFSELFRYSLNEIKGKNIDDVVVPKDKTEEAEMLSKKAEEGYVYYNTVRKKKDGTLVPVSISAAPITVEGKIIGTVGLYRDITERKRFEERLSALNTYSLNLNTAESMDEIYRVTLDAMEKTLGFENAAFMVVDKNMLYTVDQRGYPEILSFKLPLDGAKKGITVKAVKTGRPVLVPDTKKERDYVVGMPGMRSELDVPFKIGNKVLGVLSVESERLNAFDEKDQKLLEILASHAATAMSNLEHAKNLEAYAREIRESQEKFEGLFMGNPEATVYVDQDSHILDVNPRFEELFGCSLDEVKGEYLDNVVVPRDKMEEGKMLQKKALKGHFYYDTVRKRKDGSLVPVSISVAPITVGGKRVGAVGLYKDISQLRKAEKTLRNTLEKLESVNEKLRVVGRLTRHDVRNKLAAVTGNVYLAKKRLPADHENMDQLVEIESAVRQVEKIFDFARAYERLGAEELVYMGVEKDVEGAVALFSDLQGVKVVNDCRGLTVLADSLLRQLLYNLIDNSLKYGEKISQIRVYYEEADEDELKLVYEDDGVGIPKAEKKKIFKEGYGKGTGYGLYLIRKICEVYGWTIKETGKQGIGARFTITIPKMNESGKTAYRLH